MRVLAPLLLLACRDEIVDGANDSVKLVPLESWPVEVDAPPDATTPAAMDEVSPPVADPEPPLPPEPCPLAPDPAALAGCGPGVAVVAQGVGFADVGRAADESMGAGVYTVCPGVWEGPIVLQGGELRAADPTPGATVLTAPVGSPILTVLGDGVVVGLTLAHGRAPRGAAVVAYGDVELECVIAEDNVSAFGDGGAVYAEGSVTARWSTFTGNRAAGRGGSIYGTAVTVSDSVFSSGSATEGGAIATSGAIDLTRTQLVSMTAQRGGSLALGSYSGSLTSLVDVEFRGGGASSGGGLYAREWGPSALWFERVTFYDLVADQGAAAVELASDHGVDLVMGDVSFVANTGGTTGGLALSGWLVGGVRVGLEAVVWEDNAGSEAGALWASSLSDVVSVDGHSARFWRNEGALGAAGLRDGDRLTCRSCDFGAGDTDNVPVDATIGAASEGALPAGF